MRRRQDTNNKSTRSAHQGHSRLPRITISPKTHETLCDYTRCTPKKLVPYPISLSYPTKSKSHHRITHKRSHQPMRLTSGIPEQSLSSNPMPRIQLLPLPRHQRKSRTTKQQDESSTHATTTAVTLANEAGTHGLESGNQITFASHSRFNADDGKRVSRMSYPHNAMLPSKSHAHVSNLSATNPLPSSYQSHYPVLTPATSGSWHRQHDSPHIKPTIPTTWSTLAPPQQQLALTTAHDTNTVETARCSEEEEEEEEHDGDDEEEPAQACVYHLSCCAGCPCSRFPPPTPFLHHTGTIGIPTTTAIPPPPAATVGYPDYNDHSQYYYNTTAQQQPHHIPIATGQSSWGNLHPSATHHTHHTILTPSPPTQHHITTVVPSARVKRRHVPFVAVCRSE
eukprot:TRINITY_DN4930_c0_g1_i3.p1 TRINITY_DN4930_c0_g1~~TRINITY_DN4930_c0_g1_i3.p1  ORF type:complete len:395 (+),score=63.90 TRINITY_DN4930_c0_g1_i3:116-1300(+)